MNALKVMAAVAVVGLWAAGARAEDKPDYAKMMVGKWTVSKADADTVPPGTVIEFTADGKMKVAGKKDDKEMSFEGTYKVEGDKFTFTMKVGDMERMETITIVNITKTEMHTKNKDGKVVELTKKS
jgi:uncharacterized protein (TIGR03066 family)